VFYRAAALVVVGSMAGCFAQSLDAENKTCSPDALCPSAYTCVLSSPDAGICHLTPCAPTAIGLACDAGLGACLANGVTFCNAAPGGTVEQTQLVLCNAPVGTPHPETCNGIDDDCDGIIDNHLIDAMPCALQLGVCAGSKLACDGGHYESACTAGDYGPNYQVLESRCDGLDNDCDGRVDVSRSVQLADAGDFSWESIAPGAGYQLLYAPTGAGSGASVVLLQLDADFNAVGSAAVLMDPGATSARALTLRPFGAGSLAAWLDDLGGSERVVVAAAPGGSPQVVASGPPGSLGPPRAEQTASFSTTAQLIWGQQGQLMGATLGLALQLQVGPATLQFDAGPGTQVLTYDLGYPFGCVDACSLGPAWVGQISCGAGGPTDCAASFAQVDAGTQGLTDSGVLPVLAGSASLRLSIAGQAIWSAVQGPGAATITYASGG
jgi:hypothetical protein